MERKWQHPALFSPPRTTPATVVPHPSPQDPLPAAIPATHGLEDRVLRQTPCAANSETDPATIVYDTTQNPLAIVHQNLDRFTVAVAKDEQCSTERIVSQRSPA